MNSVFGSILFSWKRLGRRQKIGFFGLLFAQTFGNSIDLIGIGAIALLVMAVASGKIDLDLGGIYRLQIDYVSPIGVAWLVVLAAMAFLLRAVLNLLVSLAMVRYLAKVEVRASSIFASYLFGGSLGRVRRFSASDIQYMLNPSTAALYSGVLTSTASLFSNFVFALMVLGAFVLVNPFAAVAVAIYLLVIVTVIQSFLSKRLVRVGEAVNKWSVESSAAVLDSISAFKEIGVLGAHEHFVDNFSKARSELASIKATQEVLRATPRIVIEQGLMLGVLAFTAWQIVGTDAAAGLASLGFFLAGSVRLIGAAVPIQNAISSLKTKAVQAGLARDLTLELEEHLGHRLNLEHSHLEPRTESSRGARDESTEAVHVVIEDLEFSYPGGSEPALKRLSMEILPGSFVAVIGPSGAGKSTLADLILGLHDPSRGKVRLNGAAPSDLRREFPGLVSYVPQRPGMVSGSIAENIALGIEREAVDDDRVWEALSMASLDDVVRHFEDGLDSSIGRQSDKLSGGQLQRLGLARAIYPNPGLIVLDEATSALDAKSEFEVSENLSRFKGRATLLVIAHRLSTVQKADCVYVVDGGEIIASGTFNYLRKTVPMIEEYVRLMSFDDTEE